MRRLPLVLVGLAVLAVAEVAVLAWVGSAIGVWATVGILVVVAVIGGLVIRRAGAKAFRALADAQASADPSRVGSTLSDASLVLVGGGLLVLPGFLSDVLGLVFLFPPTRRAARKGLAAVLRGLARPYRDQAAMLDLRLRRDTVVRGEAVDPEPDAGPRPPKPDDPTVIRGEIEN